jgi:hypothetical protein
MQRSPSVCRSRPTSLGILAPVMLVAAMSAACGLAGSTPATVFMPTWDRSGPVAAAETRAIVEVVGVCVYLEPSDAPGERYLAIWPAGTTAETSPGSVALKLSVEDGSLYEGQEAVFVGGLSEDRDHVTGLVGRAIPEQCLGPYFLIGRVDT